MESESCSVSPQEPATGPYLEPDVSIDSEGFSRWCITHRITGFFGLFTIVRYSRDKKTRRFGNWICFRPQVKGGEKTPTQLGLLERANLTHLIIH
jgi:hypothetical protein